MRMHHICEGRHSWVAAHCRAPYTPPTPTPPALLETAVEAPGQEWWGLVSESFPTPCHPCQGPGLALPSLHLVPLPQ